MSRIAIHDAIIISTFFLSSLIQRFIDIFITASCTAIPAIRTLTTSTSCPIIIMAFLIVNVSLMVFLIPVSILSIMAFLMPGHKWRMIDSLWLSLFEKSALYLFCFFFCLPVWFACFQDINELSFSFIRRTSTSATRASATSVTPMLRAKTPKAPTPAPATRDSSATEKRNAMISTNASPRCGGATNWPLA